MGETADPVIGMCVGCTDVIADWLDPLVTGRELHDHRGRAARRDVRPCRGGRA